MTTSHTSMNASNSFINQLMSSSALPQINTTTLPHPGLNASPHHTPPPPPSNPSPRMDGVVPNRSSLYLTNSHHPNAGSRYNSQDPLLQQMMKSKSFAAPPSAMYLQNSPTTDQKTYQAL